MRREVICFAGCVDDCRGLGVAVNPIERKKMKKKRGATPADFYYLCRPRLAHRAEAVNGPPLGGAVGPAGLPLPRPLKEAGGAEADGLGRGRRRREACVQHPLKHGAVEGVDD